MKKNRSAMEEGRERSELAELELRAGGSLARSARKLILLIALVGAILIGLHCTPAKELLTDLDRIKSEFRSLGAWGPLIYFLGVALLTCVGFPRLGPTFLSGILFGLAVGLPLAIGATLLGSYASFCVARWCGVDWAERVAARCRRIDFLMRNQSVATVFLLRQLPITNVVLNLLLSLTQIGHGTFLVGSLLGFLPAATVVVLAGSSLGKSSTIISFFQFGLAAVIVLISTTTVWRLKRRWMSDYAD